MEYIREYTALHPKELRQLRYKRQYKSDVPGWDDSMVLLTRLIGERLTPPVHVLDIGCGHGNFVIDELGDLFAIKIGYDVSPDAVTGNTSVQRVVMGDGKILPFDPGSFDLALSLWTFEHVESPSRLFTEVFRILRPGGLFAFVTPNKRSLLIALRRLLNKKIANHLLDALYGRKDDDVFDVFYRVNTMKDIKRLATEAGFVIALLRENEDPSYTSFGSLSYLLSKWFSRLPYSFSKPHMIAILRRPI